jgi:hypothetical protein
MAKRAKKPPKKRNQPWLEAARERLRAKSPARHDDLAIQEAFAELANAAAAADPGAAPAAHAERAKMAWNLPLVHGLSVGPGSEGAEVRAEVAAWLSRPPEEIAAIVPLAEERLARFAHLTRPVLDAFAQTGALALILGREPVFYELLPLDETGWPSAGRSLLELAELALELTPREQTEQQVDTAVRIALAAWNLHTFEMAGPALPEDMRRSLHQKIRSLGEVAPEVAEAIDEMATVRRARFGYDRRLLNVRSVRLVGDEIRVDLESVDPREP